MKGKKILISIPTLHSGGAERVASILANEWSRLGNEISICLMDKNNINFYLDPRIKVLEISQKSPSKFKKINYIVNLRKIIKHYQPDIIQSFLTEYNIIALIANLGLKSRIYVSDRASPFIDRGFIIEILRKILYQFSDGIVAQTAIANDIIYTKTKNKNIRTIPNPIDLPSIPVSRVREKIILNIGRLIPEKGQADLIQIFNKTGLYKSGWKLLIVGDGPLRKELEKTIQTLGLENNIELVGKKNDVSPYLSKSSLFAFTSYSEGFPNALLEAMAYGLAVISYDCKVGPSELIRDNYNGILISNRDENLYVNQLIKLASDFSYRRNIARNAVQESKKYSSNIISMDWYNFIN